jgi:hypothetical protein
MKTIRELQKEIHELAKAKGWYDGRTREPLEYHMLFVSEIAEATESVRMSEPEFCFSANDKPCGEAAEIADAIIRMLDYAEFRGWDMQKIIELKHEYNKGRSYRHGGKAV